MKAARRRERGGAGRRKQDDSGEGPPRLEQVVGFGPRATEEGRRLGCPDLGVEGRLGEGDDAARRTAARGGARVGGRGGGPIWEAKGDAGAAAAIWDANGEARRRATGRRTAARGGAGDGELPMPSGPFCPSGELPMRDGLFARAAGRLTEEADARECRQNFVFLGSRRHAFHIHVCMYEFPNNARRAWG